MSNKIPPHAERLNIYEHTKFIPTPAAYAPGIMATAVALDCPNCTHRVSDPPFETTIVCVECGLSMQVTMAWLHIWREKPQSVAVERPDDIIGKFYYS